MPPDKSEGFTQCERCLRNVRRRGMGAHNRFCTAKPKDNTEQDMINAIVDRDKQQEQEAIRRALMGLGPQATQTNSDADDLEPLDNDYEIDAQGSHHNDTAGEWESYSVNEPLTRDEDITMNENLDDSEKPTDDNLDDDSTFNFNDIMVIKHPNSKDTEARIFSFEDYYDPDPPAVSTSSHLSTTNNLNDTINDIDNDVETHERLPWRPFRSRVDFELAEHMQGTNLNRNEIESLLKIIQKIIDSPNQFTIRSFVDLTKAWTLARDVNSSTGFQIKTFQLEFRDETLSFDVWMRPLWSWCRELLLNQELIKEFTWDAQQLLRFNGDRFVRFIDEPWTADGWWEFQSLPSTLKVPGAVPFFILLWADKTRLSSFGTVKGYPVLVRCLNLPVHIRNGTGPGGGRLVGWLPITEDTTADNRRPKYVDLKRIVWHTAMGLILESITQYAEMGNTLLCGDNIRRTILPAILMLSADYEEQAMMSLIRGAKGVKGCPGCDVPTDEMSDISKDWELRTPERTKEIISESRKLKGKDKEQLLSSYGLRDVENAFWALPGFDVHRALCFDVLHAYDSGLFKVHIYEEIKDVLCGPKVGMGIHAIDAVEKALDEIPPWPGLNHFRTITTGEMADGAKFEDLSKVILFATIHVFTPDASPRGYAILQVLRDYLELRMHASLTVHTTVTIAQGESELKRFGESLQNYIKETAHLPKQKQWNFPKAHSHKHMFRDILEKGVTRNYNTKPNEQANAPLKTTYQQRTNFKDVDSQILKINEMDLVATTIRAGIDLFDQRELQDSPNNNDSEGSNLLEDEDMNLKATGKYKRTRIGNDHVELGAARPAQTLEVIEREYSQGDPMFTNFRKRLGNAFIPLLRKRIQLEAEHEIIPYQFIKVFYRSLVDLNVEKNILRTNPNFYHKERYDCALIQVQEKKAIFVRLKFLFSIRVEQETYYMALVLPMDQIPSASNRSRDQKFRLTRVRSRPLESSVFIHVDSIIRGALLTKDHSKNSADNEYFVNQFIDQDLWMRMQPEYTQLVLNARI